MNLTKATAEVLTEILQLDQETVENLILNLRVVCRAERIVKDPHIQVAATGPRTYELGFLGLLNGIIGRLRDKRPDLFKDKEGTFLAAYLTEDQHIERFAEFTDKGEDDGEANGQRQQSKPSNEGRG